MQTEQPENTPVESAVSPSKFGNDVSFGLQQTLVCVATDFIDPFVGEKIQKRWGVVVPKNAHSTLNQTWVGELVGDFSAFFVFLGVQKFMPGLVPWLQKMAKSVAGGLYDKAAKREIRGWAKEHHVKEGTQAYNEKLNEWKDFQTETFAKSSVITVASTSANIATQMLRKNPNKFFVIAISKIAGSMITMSAMLGLRYFLPHSTRQLDTELNERYFSPLIRGTEKLFGVKGDITTGADEPKKLPPDITLTRVIADSVRPAPKAKQHTEQIRRQREADIAAKSINAL